MLGIHLEVLPKLLQVLYEEYTPALAGLTRLHDHDRVYAVFSLLLGHIALELLHLMGNNPGLRVETEVDWVLVLHLLQALCQVALLGDLIH